MLIYRISTYIIFASVARHWRRINDDHVQFSSAPVMDGHHPVPLWIAMCDDLLRWLIQLCSPSVVV
jgi:hypothetical protein